MRQGSGGLSCLHTSLCASRAIFASALALCLEGGKRPTTSTPWGGSNRLLTLPPSRPRTYLISGLSRGPSQSPPSPPPSASFQRSRRVGACAPLPSPSSLRFFLGTPLRRCLIPPLRLSPVIGAHLPHALPAPAGAAPLSDWGARNRRRRWRSPLRLHVFLYAALRF